MTLFTLSMLINSLSPLSLSPLPPSLSLALPRSPSRSLSLSLSIPRSLARSRSLLQAMDSHARQQGLTFPDLDRKRDAGGGDSACEGDAASTVSYAGCSGTQDELDDEGDEGEEGGGWEEEDEDDEGPFLQR